MTAAILIYAQYFKDVNFDYDKRNFTTIWLTSPKGLNIIKFNNRECDLGRLFKFLSEKAL